MKKLLRFALVIVAAMTMNTSFAQTNLTQAVDFTATDTEGNTWTLFDVLAEGKHVVIDFFFTTWPTCPASIPLLNATYEHFGCGDYDVIILAVDNGNSDAQVIAYDQNHGVTYPSISGTEGGGNAICSAYGIGLYPTHIIIAPDGEIIEQDIWPVSSPSDFINPLENSGCVANICDGGNPLTADFEADNLDPCDLASVQFTNTSLGDITSYSWTFEGGTPETSDEENPVVMYETPGVYDVSLTVFSGEQENTIAMEEYITVHNCTGIKNLNMRMSISPNPGEGHFNVSLPDNGTYEVQIFDLAGQEVYTTQLSSTLNQLDISHLKNGVYFLNANNGTTQLKERIVIN